MKTACALKYDTLSNRLIRGYKSYMRELIEAYLCATTESGKVISVEDIHTALNWALEVMDNDPTELPAPIERSPENPGRTMTIAEFRDELRGSA